MDTPEAEAKEVPVEEDAAQTESRRESGIKNFVQKRRASLVNLVRRSSGGPNSLEKPASGSPGSSSNLSSSASTPLFGRKQSSQDAAAFVAQMEADSAAIVLKTGTLKVLERKKVKSLEFELSSVSLRCPDAVSTRVALKDMEALTMGGSDALDHCFSLLTKMGKTVIMAGETEDETHEWALRIGAACLAFSESLGVLSYSLQVKLLGQTLAEYTGGIVKREEIEEWQYRKSGALILQNKAVATSYQWDGMNLTPKSGANYGRGVFDGVTLKWFAPEGVSMGFERKRKKKKRSHKKSASMTASPSPIVARKEVEEEGAEVKYATEPAISFLWTEINKHYHILEEGEICQGDYRNWMFSRHFLTKVKGVGHWLLEGSVPEHVCMFIQIMRFFRMGFPKDKTAEKADEASPAKD